MTLEILLIQYLDDDAEMMIINDNNKTEKRKYNKSV